MSILEDAAQRVALAWLADVPLGSYIAAPLGRALGTLLTNSQILGDPNGSGDADKGTRKAFAIPATAASDAAAAQHVSRILLAWIPGQLNSAGKPTPPPRPQPGPEPNDRNAFDELLKQIAGTPSAGTAASELKPVGQSIAAVAATTRSWTPETVIAQMKALIERVVKLILGDSPRVDELMKEFDDEASALPTRFGVAVALSATQLMPQTVASTLNAGQEVHDALQEQYRSKNVSHTVVSERTVYSPEWPIGKRLIDAANETKSLYSDFSVLQVSRFSIFSPRGNLRDDLIDLYFGDPHGREWEIKPAASTPEGVLQECWYRFAYNVWAIAYEDRFGLPMRTKKLVSGPGWTELDPSSLSPFLIKSLPGVIVWPYCLDILPGLVIYSLVKGPSLKELEELMSEVLSKVGRRLRELEQELEQLGEAAAKALKALAERVTEVVQKFGAIFVAVAAIVVLLIVLAASLPADAIILVGGALTLLFGTAAASQPTASSSSNQPVTIQFGGCKLRNIRLNDLRKHLGAANRALAAALKPTLDALRSDEAVT